MNIKCMAMPLIAIPLITMLLMAVAYTASAHDDGLNPSVEHFHFDQSEIRFPYSDATIETKIKEWNPDTYVRLDGQTGVYNCHGATFGCGESWIDNPASAIKDAEVVSRLEARIGDIIVFYNDDYTNAAHSSVILSARFTWGSTWVQSKHGIAAHYAERFNNTEGEYGHDYIIVRPSQGTALCIYGHNGWLEYDTGMINDDNAQVYADWVVHYYGLPFNDLPYNYDR